LFHEKGEGSVAISLAFAERRREKKLSLHPFYSGKR